MKLTKLAFLAAVCAGTSASAAEGPQAAYRSHETPDHAVAEVGWQKTSCGCGEPICGCEAIDVPAYDAVGMCDGGCDGACDSLGTCGGHCPLGFTGGLLDCDLGEPYTLFGHRAQWTAGGWVQLGYHNKDIPLFNQHRDNLNLHQAWLYAERAIDTSGGFDIGGRIDYVYGVDAQDTQAFGTDPRGWDNDWDHGIYGHALPQVYGEAGYGDLSVKVGHFFRLVGFEGIPAPNNFFYSHTYTMYNSEPFTHTGALASYEAMKDLTLFGGYTLGWDSGFDDNGDNFLGGFAAHLGDGVNFAYQTTIGRFGEARFNGVEKGYMHSVVIDAALSDKLRYVYQNDYLDTENAAGTTQRHTFGINQYLIYSLSDCISVGTRAEWYNNRGIFNFQPAGQENDIYAWTVGANYQPHANVLFRPEIRSDWDSGRVAGLEDGNQQTTFGFDMIYTF